MTHARSTPERLSVFSDGVFEVSQRERKIMRFRSIATLCLFGLAVAVALKYPLVGLGLCCCCLIVYLKPDPPAAGKQISRSAPKQHGHRG